MGIAFAEVSFDGRAPEPSRIVAEVTEITGLPGNYNESSSEIRGDLYAYHGQAVFRDLPSSQIQLYAYLSGAVKRDAEIFYADANDAVRRFPNAQYVEGIDESEERQSVHVRIYVGQEPTLYCATIVALERLGGRAKRPLSAGERDKYGRALTLTELKRRQRMVTAQLVGVLLIGCVVWPVTIPLWLLTLPLAIPWCIWKAYRLTRTWQDP
jgi:hypothetical protein